MGFFEGKEMLAWAKRALCSFCVILMFIGEPVQCIGVNWGTQASHQLPPSIVVQLIKDNNIPKVKLFDSDEKVLKAFAGTNIEVMVAIPNLLLESMTDDKKASDWVQQNVAPYIFEGGVNIKYVAVGNEPFLTSYNGSFLNSTFPALSNIQNALNSANLGDKIKATVPLNADVLEDVTLPSQGTFRSDISQLMTQIVQFLQQNGCPFTINIYPFLSLVGSVDFPIEFAFFDGNAAPKVDGTKTYNNVFDASYDTLVAALVNAGTPNISIIVGEIGWPTDGNINANYVNAKRFNQGFLNHVSNNGGTPSRPNTTIDFYIFGLLDEDQKSIAPGNFERHWGIFRYDGVSKYSMALPGASGNGTLVNAQGVQYLQQRWCVLSDSADISQLDAPVTYACAGSDCTSLGYGCSCNPYLDTRGNASYAFNQYFQLNNQDLRSCSFDGLGSLSYDNPSVDTCLFMVQLAYTSAAKGGAVGLVGALISVSLSAYLLLAQLL